MNKTGIGVGSASIMLVFTGLCLTVFSLISYTVASNDKILVDAEAQLVINYYEADARAEYILAEILQADAIPDSIDGTEIKIDRDSAHEADVVGFFYPITDAVGLLVEASIYEDSFSILSWRMWNTGQWVADESLNVWQGD